MVDSKTIAQTMEQTMEQAVQQAVQQAVRQAVQQANKQAMAQTMDSESEITLGLLNAVEENDKMTQRSMAMELGIALGLANAYLKRCVKKGYIKVRQIPRNRYAYYLTPKGFAAKSRLTAEYLSQSFKFFRLARAECEDLFALATERGWKTIALFGVSDLGEIATLCAREYSLTLAGFIDAEAEADYYAGLRVYRDLSDMNDMGGVDAVIITDLRNPQESFAAACDALPPERVLTLGFMKISRQPPRMER